MENPPGSARPPPYNRSYQHDSEVNHEKSTPEELTTATPSTPTRKPLRYLTDDEYLTPISYRDEIVLPPQRPICWEFLDLVIELALGGLMIFIICGAILGFSVGMAALGIKLIELSEKSLTNSSGVSSVLSSSPGMGGAVASTISVSTVMVTVAMQPGVSAFNTTTVMDTSTATSVLTSMTTQSIDNLVVDDSSTNTHTVVVTTFSDLLADTSTVDSVDDTATATAWSTKTITPQRSGSSQVSPSSDAVSVSVSISTLLSLSLSTVTATPTSSSSSPNALYGTTGTLSSSSSSRLFTPVPLASQLSQPRPNTESSNTAMSTADTNTDGDTSTLSPSSLNSVPPVTLSLITSTSIDTATASTQPGPEQDPSVPTPTILATMAMSSSSSACNPTSTFVDVDYCHWVTECDMQELRAKEKCFRFCTNGICKMGENDQKNMPLGQLHCCGYCGCFGG